MKCNVQHQISLLCLHKVITGMLQKIVYTSSFRIIVPGKLVSLGKNLASSLNLRFGLLFVNLGVTIKPFQFLPKPNHLTGVFNTFCGTKLTKNFPFPHHCVLEFIFKQLFGLLTKRPGWQIRVKVSLFQGLGKRSLETPLELPRGLEHTRGFSFPGETLGFGPFNFPRGLSQLLA